jgi:Ca-activated chloride channel family protein
MFQFANPWLFLLLPLPILIWWLLPPVKKQMAALRVPFFNKISEISLKPTTSLTHLFPRSFILAFLAWILLVSAAAGPQWLGAPLNQVREGRDMMLAVDLSGSMQTPDMNASGYQLSRLDVVKEIASEFIRQREGDRLGLILFGTRAYLQTPLTFDRTTVLAMLDDATIGLAGPETAIGDAIGLAVKRLQTDTGAKRVLILLTDGINNSGVLTPLQGAQLATKAGIRIYTIGVGADTLLVSGLFGTQTMQAASELDEQELKDIAQMTGGLFFRAKDRESLQQAYQMLDQLEPVKSDDVVLRPIKPLYPWPLGMALLLSLVVARSRHCLNLANAH